MAICYLATGSNLGHRLDTMRLAVCAIAETRGIELDPAVDVASLYETSPVGVSGQPDYLNSVIRFQTDLAPRDLISAILSIESRLGRVRSEHWCSRTIDLDLLLYDDLVLNDPELGIPHPRLHERLFVLEPLYELAPDLLHPTIRKSVKELMEEARLKRPEDRIQRIAGPESIYST